MRRNTISLTKRRPITKADLLFQLIEFSNTQQHEKYNELNDYINVLIKQEKTTGVYISELKYECVSSFFPAS